MDKSQNFVVWLDGYLEATGDSINVSKTNLIKNKLYGLFEHEAEKLGQIPKEPKPTLEELGEKHGFEVKNDNPLGNGKMRC